MKRQRLDESEMDVKMDSAIKSFKSLSEEEKIKWKTVIKQCIEELGYSRMIKTDELTLGWMAALAAAGLIFSIPFLIGMAVIPAVFVGVVDKDKIIKVIKCARNKRKGDIPSQPSSQDNTQIQETKMKKTIRLTESELVKLVQRIIKEDEMSADSSINSPKGITLLQLGIKEPSYMVSLNGYTPFYVNGKEQKKNIDIQPTDVLSSKNCMVEFVGNKSNKNFTLVFDNNGKASIRK